MKRYSLLVGCFFLSGSAPGQRPTWQVYPIDQQLAVYLPAPPRELDVPKTMAVLKPKQQLDPKMKASQGFVAEDKVALYTVIKVPLDKPAELPSTYAERVAYYKARTIPILTAQRELLAQEISSKDGVDLVTVKTRGFDPTGSVQVKYVRMLTIGKAVYQLHFTPLDKRGDQCAAQRQKFFDIVLLPAQK
ncbi:hypothetical protein F1C16_20395 (plasmid) [Hymenobacter sp. NBH84]|uniref:hypothetical protein n=1 Tax=Hymenobacter sp. NBH84 TaxID=2596915 RepID=UPI001625E1DA|nr:hypothetical protein [Hymenobacter sp. NBH84]QNE41988.1 hypothetical protein F1C16_20395 [Hymenobacter sp. NBH84]